jgi:hypothetical protein
LGLTYLTSTLFFDFSNPPETPGEIIAEYSQLFRSGLLTFSYSTPAATVTIPATALVGGVRVVTEVIVSILVMILPKMLEGDSEIW